MSLPVIALSDTDAVKAKRMHDRLRELKAEKERIDKEQQELNDEFNKFLRKTADIEGDEIRTANISDDGKYVVVTGSRGY